MKQTESRFLFLHLYTVEYFMSFSFLDFKEKWPPTDLGKLLNGTKTVL